VPAPATLDLLLVGVEQEGFDQYRCLAVADSPW